MTQVAEHLANQHKSLSSNSSIANKEKEKEKGEKEKESKSHETTRSQARFQSNNDPESVSGFNITKIIYNIRHGSSCYNHNTQETETGRTQVQSQHGLHARLCLKKIYNANQKQTLPIPSSTTS
jgi:hypothetical protein